MSSSSAPLKLVGGRGRNPSKSAKPAARSVAPTSAPRNGRVWPNIVDLETKKLSIERHLALKPAGAATYTKIISEGQMVGFQIRNATMLVPLREDNYGGHNFSLGLSQDYNQLQALLDLDTVWTSLENYPLLQPDFAGDYQMVGKSKVWGEFLSQCPDAGRADTQIQGPTATAWT